MVDCLSDEANFCLLPGQGAEAGIPHRAIGQLIHEGGGAQ